MGYIRFSELPEDTIPQLVGDDCIAALDKSASQIVRTSINHAVSTSAFGLGDASNYGHAKLIDNINTSSSTSGAVLSAYQGYQLAASFGTIESSSTASIAYAVGDVFVFQGHLVRCIAPIARGASIAIGHNVEIYTFDDAVEHAESSSQGKFDELYNQCIAEGSPPTAATPEAIAAAIHNIRYTGNATTADILSGYSGYAGRSIVNGGMRSIPTTIVHYMPASASSTVYTIPQGCHSGSDEYILDGTNAYKAGYRAEAAVVRAQIGTVNSAGALSPTETVSFNLRANEIYFICGLAAYGTAGLDLQFSSSDYSVLDGGTLKARTDIDLSEWKAAMTWRIIQLHNNNVTLTVNAGSSYGTYSLIGIR